MKPLIAVLGPTATGKSALGLALAERLGGEIINCDSTAVYRGFDIGTDKVPLDRAPRHSASPDRHRRADRRVHGGAYGARCGGGRSPRSTRAGKLPILVGGTGFYFRALTRGPVSRARQGRRAARAARSDRRAARRGVPVADGDARRSRVGARIQPRDRKRLIRALEVYFQTGRPLTAHFADTVSPLGGRRRRSARSRLRHAGRRGWPSDWPRASMRSSRPGCSTRSGRCWRAACRPSARPFGGLVYRQVMEHLRGVRDRSGNAGTDCAGEPALRAPPVDLVPQRA